MTRFLLHLSYVGVILMSNPDLLSRYTAPEVFGEGDTVMVQLLGDLAIDMGKVFRD